MNLKPDSSLKGSADTLLARSPQGKTVHSDKCQTKYPKKSPTRVSWTLMWARCTNPNFTGFKWYGARGISVCERWRKFATFLSDMGERPAGKTLDRKDNSGNYEPSNCKWSTLEEQNSNKRNSRLLTFNGKTQSISAWSRDTGFGQGSIWSRLNKGWSVERALTEPITRNRPAQILTIIGRLPRPGTPEEQALKDWCHRNQRAVQPCSYSVQEARP